jgi:hypothetical protein
MDRPRLRRDVTPQLLTDRVSVAAPWLNEVFGRLNELINLPEDWDSYGAKSPSRTAADAIMEILTTTTSSQTPAPTIVPSPHGHFQAEWHVNGVDLEVEVLSPGHIDVFFSSNRTRWSNVLKSDLSLLVAAIDQLTPA